jgi:putative copper resistance protein D
VTFLIHSDLISATTLGLLTAAALYVWGAEALRKRGDRWAAGRTAMFLIGLIMIGLALVSGLEAYDTTLVSVHMVQHMLLSMVAPIFLALGAPVTLALRTLPARPRAVLLAILHSRIARLYTFPLVSFALFVASPFILYFSGLYRLSLEHVWVHQLVHVHLIAVGCLFFWPLIGLDPVPGRVPYPMRALLMFLSTPFHTVLGLTVMQSGTLLGGDWYPLLHLSWADPAADQRLAGGILWAGGEFIAVAMLAALVWQWIRESEREARRIDRALDRAESAAQGRSPRGTSGDGRSGPDNAAAGGSVPSGPASADDPATEAIPGAQSEKVNDGT